jgi:hypothetical protein
MADIVKIYQKDFKVDRLNEVRDVFIFSCFTGFAYGDVRRLTEKDIVIGMMVIDGSLKNEEKPQQMKWFLYYLSPMK